MRGSLVVLYCRGVGRQRGCLAHLNHISPRLGFHSEPRGTYTRGEREARPTSETKSRRWACVWLGVGLGATCAPTTTPARDRLSHPDRRPSPGSHPQADTDRPTASFSTVDRARSQPSSATPPHTSSPSPARTRTTSSQYVYHFCFQRRQNGSRKLATRWDGAVGRARGPAPPPRAPPNNGSRARQITPPRPGPIWFRPR